MSLQSGQGGSVTVPGPLTIAVGTWSGNWTSRLAEVTQSDAGGGTRYFPVCQDPSWSFSCARDDSVFPEAIGLVPGAVIASILFKLGAGSQYDKVSVTTVESVSPVVDNAGDVVRVTVSGKGGLVSPSVAG